MPTATAIQPASPDTLVPVGPVRRHESLDTVRGALLVLMAVNHIPSILWWLTQQPLGFMSAAEGFVFLAGLVIGLVYTRRWDRDGARETTRAVLKRAATIYKYHLGCVLGIFVWMVVYVYAGEASHPPPGSPWVWFTHPWTSWLATLMLANQPGLLDVLPTYCGLLVFTPVFLWQATRGHLTRMLVLSFIWWGLTNLLDPPRPTVIGVINTGAFNFGAWQLIYVIGLAAGFAWSRRILPRWQPRPLTVALLIGLVIFLSACSHGWLTLGLSKDTWFAISNKNNLAPVRMLNVGVLLLLAHLCLRNRQDDLGCPWLAMMGRHSLAVFSVHCVVAIMILGLPQLFEGHPYGHVTGPILLVMVMFVTAWIADRPEGSGGGRKVRLFRPKRSPAA